MVLCIDLDAPFTGFPFLSPILHWLQPGLRAAATSSRDGHELTAPNVPFVVDYRGAGPPPGSGPHRYLFLLYQQPAGFDGKRFGQPAERQKIGLFGRVRYNLVDFVKQARLGQPVAGNWFVSN